MGEAMLFEAQALADGSVQLGPLRVRPRQAVAAGAVKVAVRPEAWRLRPVDAAPPDAPSLPGTVRKCAYLGGQNGAKNLAENLGVPFLGEVPIVQSIREAADAGRPAALQGPDGAEKAIGCCRQDADYTASPAHCPDHDDHKPPSPCQPLGPG